MYIYIYILRVTYSLDSGLGVVVVWETLAKPAGMEGRPDTELVRPERRGNSLKGFKGFDRLTHSGEVSRGEKMALRGTDPESYITKNSLVYEDNLQAKARIWSLLSYECHARSTAVWEWRWSGRSSPSSSSFISQNVLIKWFL